MQNGMKALRCLTPKVLITTYYQIQALLMNQTWDVLIFIEPEKK